MNLTNTLSTGLERLAGDVKSFSESEAFRQFSDVRAQRRMKELAERCTPRPYDEVLHEIEERDWADTHREIAPLRRAEDAVLVDTSAMDFDESRRAILDVIRRSVEA